LKKEGVESKDYSRFIPRVIFTYSTEHLPKKDKVRFYYGLKGRDGKTGVVRQYKIEQLGRTVLLVPVQFAAEVDEFLKFWKCEYQKREVLIKP
jgi:hypothetical protein